MQQITKEAECDHTCLNGSTHRHGPSQRHRAPTIAHSRSGKWIPFRDASGSPPSIVVVDQICGIRHHLPAFIPAAKTRLYVSLTARSADSLDTHSINNTIRDHNPRSDELGSTASVLAGCCELEGLKPYEKNAAIGIVRMAAARTSSSIDSTFGYPTLPYEPDVAHYCTRMDRQQGDWGFPKRHISHRYMLHLHTVHAKRAETRLETHHLRVANGNEGWSLSGIFEITRSATT